MENFNLLQILEAFCAPINEEQAWAVCYQCAKYLQIYLAPTLNENSVNTTSSKMAKQCRRNQKLDDHVFTLRDVALNSDGNVVVTIAKTSSTIQEKMVVQALGILVFQALDYGLNDTEEQKISPALESLISRMTGEDVPQDGDEGIVDDERADEVMCLEDVVQECIKHIGTSIDVRAHCKAVCRALVHEAGELIMFLERVVSENEKKNLCGQLDAVDQNQLHSLQRKDWARLWMQVMKELRQGVKLKKVQQSIGTHPVEFEFTPYEILMDDVRCKRYTLNKVEKIEDSYPIKVKKDVHEIILDFIRSRPPLQPVNKRVLSAYLERNVDPREQLLHDIRTIKPQLKPTPRGAFENAHSTSTDRCAGQVKKVIKPDLSLLSFGSFDNEFDSTSENHNHLRDDDKNKVAVQDLIPLTPLSPKSPPKHLPWQHTDDWCSPLRRNEKNKTNANEMVPSSCHSSSSPLAFFPSSSSSLATSHQDSAKVVSSNKLPESSAKNRLLEFRDFNVASTVECLSLTIEEVMHIRGVLTKAELECASVNPELHSLLENGKVCFSCKKVKFSIFGPWPTKCKFCCRNVCSRCSSKMRIPTEHFEHIPVYTLNPCPSSPLNSTTIQNLDSLSGSAPSSPERELPKFSESACSEPDDEQMDRFQKVTKPPLLKSMRLSEAPLPSSRGLFQRSQTVRPRSAAPGSSSGQSRSRMLEGGPLMNVCSDCRSMVVGIIRASRRCLVLLGQRGSHARAERAYSACPSSRRSFNSTTSFDSTGCSDASHRISD